MEVLMPLRIVRAGKKVVTTAAAIIGVGSAGSVSVGESLTGEVIVDAILIVGAVVIVLINGKDGVPDWLVHLLGKKTREEESGQKS